MSDALIRNIGPVLVHVTAASNLPLIEAHGLLPAATLATGVEIDPHSIHLRSDRRQLTTPNGVVTLNHQRPITQSGDAPERVLDGHTRASWAAQLDRRVFFSPERLHKAFTASVGRDVPLAVIRVDTAKLLAFAPDLTDLAPINTGNFRQGGAYARRGDWVYCKLTDGYQTFRSNRRNRGLVKGLDSVKEVSLRCAIPPDVLTDIRIME